MDSLLIPFVGSAILNIFLIVQMRNEFGEYRKSLKKMADFFEGLLLAQHKLYSSLLAKELNIGEAK